MPLLAINTASSNTAIALINSLENPKILDQDTWQSDKNEAESLLPKINEMLKKHDLHFDQLDEILAISGPGSFTGLRVGVTVANTISYLNKSKLYAVNTFEYWWTAYEKDFNVENSALLIFAGRRGVYVSLSPNNTDENSVKIINIDELEEYLSSNNIKFIFGDITEEQKSTIKNVTFNKINTTFAEVCAQCKDLKSTPIIMPLYVKNPDITPSKKSLYN